METAAMQSIILFTWGNILIPAQNLLSKLTMKCLLQSPEGMHQANSLLFQNLERAKEAALHHYSKSFRGFSAMLTPEQAQRVAESNGIVSVFESRTNKLHTTHTWDFLGIDSSTI
ncbi:hypothetical protein V6N13_094642 [Hibiscus sabdariffa]